MIDDDFLKWVIEKQDESATLEYKEKLHLDTDGDKAQFIKNIISLANSGVKSHLIIGVEDTTRRLLGVNDSFKSEQLNEILKNRCDPALTMEYEEKNIYGYNIGVIEIQAYNPPYLISVHDKFGGKLTDNPKKNCTICRGTVYIRRHNQNEGACRADIDRIYMAKSLQPYLEVKHDIQSNTSKGNVKNILLSFKVTNLGTAPAYGVFLTATFKNAMRVIPHSIAWHDNTHFNNNIPSLCTLSDFPLIPNSTATINSLEVEVPNNINQIEVKTTVAAINMQGVILKDPYKIKLI